ncbi:MAG: AmmeMemoRadiSam system protein A [Bacillota bacterium]
MGKIAGAFILPHPPIMIREVGGKESDKVSMSIEAANEVALRIAELKPDAVIIITPHGPLFRDAVSIVTDPKIKGSLKNFGAPDVSFEYESDSELISAISDAAGSLDVSCVQIDEDIKKSFKVNTDLDHGASVPLYFIRKRYNAFKLVHITYSLLPFEDNYRFGMAIRNAVKESGKKVVVIASGDLSHKLTPDAPAGYSDKGEEFDKLFVQSIKNGDIMKLMSLEHGFLEEAGECGLRSAIMLFGVLDGAIVRGEILSYEGPFGVGYCIAQLQYNDEPVKGEDSELLRKYMNSKQKSIEQKRNNEDHYVRLARHTLEEYVRNGRLIKIPDGLPAEMLEAQAGVFVSIKKDGVLRGCIGTIAPTRRNIAEEIINNAISAGTKDPRFLPVCEDELEQLTYSVDVLMEPETVVDRNMLDVNKYGVIVRKGYRTGLLLPNLEGVDTVEYQLEIALSKAGIRKDEDYEIQRFEVVRHY